MSFRRDKVSQLRWRETPPVNLIELNVHAQDAKLASVTIDLSGVTLRTLEVYESAFNAHKLDENQWHFQIAKSVATPDQVTGNFNVVWQSKAVAPRTTIQWKDQYGLNWTSTLPAAGVSVTIGGEWQACNLGQVFDLGPDGFWTASSVPKTDNYMKVGKINYQYPGVVGLHIVIGIQNSDGGFDAIYLDPTALTLNDTASYQPQEVIEWWYQTKNETATMISTAATAIGTVNFSVPAPTTNLYYYSTTYNYESGNWITSEDPPPQGLYAPPQQGADPNQVPPPPLFSLWPSSWQGVLSVAVVGSDKQASVSASLKSLLQIRYGNVEVKFIDSLDIAIKLGTPKDATQNSQEAIGAPNDDTKAVISDSLQYLLDDGALPDKETWVIKKALDLTF